MRVFGGTLPDEHPAIVLEPASDFRVTAQGGDGSIEPLHGSARQVPMGHDADVMRVPRAHADVARQRLGPFDENPMKNPRRFG